MTRTNEITQTLRELGLTRTEAEVYLATLQAAGAGPVSGYKVAQGMGRDPANLAKTLSALVKCGAVRVVQEKPRLYLPEPPADFTDALIRNTQNTGARAVQLLADLTTPAQVGLPLALREPEQAFDRARHMLLAADREIALYASPDVIDCLGDEIVRAVDSCSGIAAVAASDHYSLKNVDTSIIPMSAGLSQFRSFAWLQLVVDAETWLVARLDLAEDAPTPCGWWGHDPVLATIMASGLNAAVTGSVQPAAPTPASPEPEPEQVSEENVEPAAGGATGFESGVIPEAIPETDEDNDDDGIKFIIKHEEG